MDHKSNRVDNPILSYANAMRDAMVAAGLGSSYASDAANNLALPFVVEPDLDAVPVMENFLTRQRQHFGLVATDEDINRFAVVAAAVSRPVEEGNEPGR